MGPTDVSDDQLLERYGAGDESAFDQLFSTPHGTDLPAIGRAMGFAVTAIAEDGRIDQADDADGRPRLIVVRTTVEAMTGGVAGLRAAVADALR